LVRAGCRAGRKAARQWNRGGWSWPLQN